MGEALQTLAGYLAVGALALWLAGRWLARRGGR